MDASESEIYHLVEWHDGLTFGQLCLLTTLHDARVGMLLKHLTETGMIYRSGHPGKYCYHFTPEQALKAVRRSNNGNLNPRPKEDYVALYKAVSPVYRFEQLLRQSHANEPEYE